jgi:hypothetical protein
MVQYIQNNQSVVNSLTLVAKGQGNEIGGVEGMAQRVHVEHKDELDSTSRDRYKALQRSALWGD